MGWSIGYDNNWKRDVGYGVPALCDHPKCSVVIDRGIGYICGGYIYGGEKGCGLFFCSKHQMGSYQRCAKCTRYDSKKYNPKPDLLEWEYFKLKDKSWKQWRNRNRNEVVRITKRCETLQDILDELHSKNHPFE